MVGIAPPCLVGIHPISWKPSKFGFLRLTYNADAAHFAAQDADLTEKTPINKRMANIIE